MPRSGSDVDCYRPGGWYLISLAALWAASATGDRIMYVYSPTVVIGHLMARTLPRIMHRRCGRLHPTVIYSSRAGAALISYVSYQLSGRDLTLQYDARYSAHRCQGRAA